MLNRDIGGESREIISIDYDNDDHNIGFNGRYLLEILDIIKTPKVMIRNEYPNKCVFNLSVYENKLIKNEDLFLIMPLRIMEEL